MVLNCTNGIENAVKQYKYTKMNQNDVSKNGNGSLTQNTGSIWMDNILTAEVF